MRTWCHDNGVTEPCPQRYFLLPVTNFNLITNTHRARHCIMKRELLNCHALLSHVHDIQLRNVNILREWNFTLFFRRPSLKARPLPSLNGFLCTNFPRLLSVPVIVSYFSNVTFFPLISRCQGERLVDDEQPISYPGDMPVVRLL